MNRINTFVRIDIATGKVIERRSFPYYGSKALAMPNVRSSIIKNFGQLQGSITPQVPGQPERIPWTWYDSQTYTSGTTTSLDFFQTVQTDKVLGNMQAAGQIPAPMYFEVHHLGVWMDVPPTDDGIDATPVTPAPGAFNDILALGQGRVVFDIAQKTYYEAPIFLCPAGGGPHGAISATGTFTAPDGSAFQIATNGVPDLRNRNNFWGDLMIPHNQNFLVRLQWTAALTLASGNTIIQVNLDGYLYRRVL